jgi:hypothetical protein
MMDRVLAMDHPKIVSFPPQDMRQWPGDHEQDEIEARGSLAVGQQPFLQSQLPESTQ